MISIVIPAYNRKDCVLKLLDCLYRQQGAEFEVIVVDDHSRDGTVEALAAAYPQVIVLTSEVNRGPAVARNRGIRQARGEIIVGLDSDVTVPDPRLLEKMTGYFLERPDLTGFAFRVLRPDGGGMDTLRWWHPRPIETYADKWFQTTYFSGTAFAFRREALVAAGMFPEILFMHHEEVELAYRLLDGGGTILYCPDLEVIHHEDKVARRVEVRLFYNPRNHILLAVACYPWLRAARFLAPRLAYSLWLSLRWGQPRVFLRMLVSAARLAPRRLKERKPLKRSTWKRIAALRQGVCT